MAVTTIDLIRHGEPVGGRKYRGQTDDPLSEKGLKQMWSSVGGFHDWQQIISSPLLRCSAFSQLLHEKWGIPVKHDARLKEVVFGEWEGKTPQELKEGNPDILLDFKLDPIGNRPAGAETLDAFHARVSQAWQAIQEEYYGQHVLVVCHAGVIRMILAHVLGIPLANVYKIQVASAAITRMAVEGQGARALTSLLFHDGKLDSNRKVAD
ncbi:histidine phosphatase family protein [Sulfurirhabdus autotrophica]|uniref:Alpha-ribazole phosphatase/probable phosphoglycerate mutase n=1 Tax=Sulfurirhabdus autotrophica TaxID=1706046 RepID=A0A4R3XTS0_9PROT|nr:histidine phosphatase family protein [Sulfurirhabdus autotrophica]TCV81297.1 alpha-ribazole phosphatase/probable phosphoglycerate mutase [Sulfurirhabdus autotrophica]